MYELNCRESSVCVKWSLTGLTKISYIFCIS